MDKTINWSPLKQGGANFKTKKLVTENPNQWRYENTGWSKLFPMIFIWMGIFGTFMFLITVIFFFMAIVPLIFLVIGIIWRKRSNRAIVFDFDVDAFWKGDKKFHPSTGDLSKVDDMVNLKDIYAIQILAETVESQRTHNNDGRFRNYGPEYYDSYEMNLVMNDSSRINVVDHASLNSIKREADMIAGKLGIPVLLADNLQ